MFNEKHFPNNQHLNKKANECLRNCALNSGDGKDKIAYIIAPKKISHSNLKYATPGKQFSMKHAQAMNELKQGRSKSIIDMP